ncbi:MAG TPA: hypothetical protein VF122_07005 [Caulobacteraceae bacterium]
MKNVTISMDEATLAWVRVRAAKAGKSVSRWIGEQLAHVRGQMISDEVNADAQRAVEAFLAHPGWDLGGKGFDRDEIYEERLRGLERRHLQRGPGRQDETRNRAGVAETSRKFRSGDDEPSGPE